MKDEKIQLLQFFICDHFNPKARDGYNVEGLRSNLYVKSFPFRFTTHRVVTCWRKDSRFHKEVLEYETDYGAKARSIHMDIEPVRDQVLFRWHTHRFPKALVIEKPTTLWIRVLLDREKYFESYLLIEEIPKAKL